jgi:hypothetical protein
MVGLAESAPPKGMGEFHYNSTNALYPLL